MAGDLIPIVAILMPLVLVPTVMVLKQNGKRREMLHRERMRAIELGVPVPGAEVWSSRAAMAIGAGMPVGVFGVAWLASVSTAGNSPQVWLAATLVGGLGVLCGTRLAGRSIRARPRDKRSAPCAAGHGRSTVKPPFNPDAYDEIAHRS